MSNPLSLIGSRWRKNWPEVHGGLTGGLPGFIFRKNPGTIGEGVPVFCYHVIDMARFREDLSFLSRNGYTTLTADGLLDHVAQREIAPPRSVVLSFDDGQQTLYDIALPLLREFGHKAVAFICPGLHRDPGDRDAQPAGGLCDWGQISEMHDSGHIDFQPHTNSHRYVPRWPMPLPLAGVDENVADRRRPTESSLDEDLRRAKEELDRRLGKISLHLAFPQYSGTESAIQTAKKLGYRGFWWGVLPGRPINSPGDRADRIVRISGEFVRRLPGEGRVKLADILKHRYDGRLHSA